MGKRKLKVRFKVIMLLVLVVADILLVWCRSVGLFVAVGAAGARRCHLHVWPWSACFLEGDNEPV